MYEIDLRRLYEDMYLIFLDCVAKYGKEPKLTYTSRAIIT
jgi:hypothetical protein